MAMNCDLARAALKSWLHSYENNLHNSVSYGHGWAAISSLPPNEQAIWSERREFITKTSHVMADAETSDIINADERRLARVAVLRRVRDAHLSVFRAALIRCYKQNA
jgi:hypothetical protein